MSAFTLTAGYVIGGLAIVLVVALIARLIFNARRGTQVPISQVDPLDRDLAEIQWDWPEREAA